MYSSADRSISRPKKKRERKEIDSTLLFLLNCLLLFPEYIKIAREEGGSTQGGNSIPRRKRTAHPLKRAGWIYREKERGKKNVFVLIY